MTNIAQGIQLIFISNLGFITHIYIFAFLEGEWFFEVFGLRPAAVSDYLPWAREDIRYVSVPESRIPLREGSINELIRLLRVLYKTHILQI